MPLSLHTLSPARGARKRVKRLGRGNASGRGSYSTKGIKGQRARQGGRKGLGQLGVKHFISHLPKVRGFASFSLKPAVIMVSDLAGFAPDSVVDRAALVAKGLVDGSHHGDIKLIGQGALPKLTVKLQAASSGARAAIKAAGGTFEVVVLPKSKKG